MSPTNNTLTYTSFEKLVQVKLEHLTQIVDYINTCFSKRHSLRMSRTREWEEVRSRTECTKPSLSLCTSSVPDTKNLSLVLREFSFSWKYSSLTNFTITKVEALNSSTDKYREETYFW